MIFKKKPKIGLLSEPKNKDKNIKLNRNLKNQETKSVQDFNKEKSDKNIKLNRNLKNQETKSVQDFNKEKSY